MSQHSCIKYIEWTINFLSKSKADSSRFTCSIPHSSGGGFSSSPSPFVGTKRKEKKSRTFTFVHRMRIGQFLMPQVFPRRINERWPVAARGAPRWEGNMSYTWMTLKAFSPFCLTIYYWCERRSIRKGRDVDERERTCIYEWRYLLEKQKINKKKIVEKISSLSGLGPRALVLVARENSLTAFSVAYKAKQNALLLSFLWAHANVLHPLTSSRRGWSLSTRRCYWFFSSDAKPQ